MDRAARLLTEVVHAPGSVTFTELAAATGLAKSTTSRLLLALERNGLVRRDDAGRFRPGEMFVRFAWRGGAEAGLTEVAQPFLDRLGRDTGETVNLGVGRDGMVEQIAQVDSVYVIGATNWLGRAVPLHSTAIGKVLLAYGAAQPVGGADYVHAVHLGDLLDHAVPADAQVHGFAGGPAEPVEVGLSDLGQPGLGAAAPGEPDEHLSGAELARLVPPDEPVALEREQQP